MKHLKTLGLAVAALALLAFAAAGTASATELYKLTAPNPSDTLGVGTEIEMSLSAGTSMTWKHTYEGKPVATAETCVNGGTKFKLEKAGGGEGVHPSGKVTGLSLIPCSDKIAVLKPGEMEIQHIPGTTNGSVISKEAETTIYSTVFGLSCVVSTGSGTKTGTLTGATSSTGHATFDIEATIPFGICGTVFLTSSHRVTSPTGLVVEGS